MGRYLNSLLVLVCGLGLGFAAQAQEGVVLGREHARLKELVGTWDAVVKFDGNESKGQMVYTLGLGGNWLLSDFNGEFGGTPFQGKGADGFDQQKGKYISIWLDSMSTSPTISEGTLDASGKVMTMYGDMMGPDGKSSKTRMVTEMTDKDHMVFTIYGKGPNGQEGPMMSIHYTRRKSG